MITEGKMFDVAVIGGGVIGGTILRELAKYQLEVCLLEKADDVCMGQSKANSGIVHAGFDAAEGTLKAKFNVEGNKMMPTLCKDLGVKYKNNGSLVVAFSDEDVKTLYALKERGEKNGVTDMEIIGRDELRALEKNISDNAVGALWAKTGGIVCPYELTIASIGNAMDNGAKLFTNFGVVGGEKTQDGYIIRSADGKEVAAKYVIICAGLGSEQVANGFGDDSLKTGGRKGEYILLDRESGDFVSHTLFFTPTAKGKGILVSQTVDNNIILGPTAEDIANGSTATSAEGLAAVISKANEMCKNVPIYNSITSFTGVRSYCDRHDFIIEESRKAENVFLCAGIESPGLTSSPAIAKYVVEELIGRKVALTRKPNFNGKRKADCFFKNLTNEEKNEIIRKDPTYGNIVCRCEQITEGEIVRAVRENPPAKNIDAVKRRTRAGMGRCQGGFCQPHVAEIIARELNIGFEEVTKNGKNSELVTGRCK